jgi:hypothetical protein
MASFTLALGAGAALSGTASPGSFYFNDNNRSWYDIIEASEEARTTRILRMTDAEWREEGIRMIRAWQGQDISICVAYLERMDIERASYATRAEQPNPAPRQRTEFDNDFALWREMIEEPAKFGDDIVEWLALDAKLSQGAGRWRLGAYWTQRQLDEDTAEAALMAPWRSLYSRLAKEAAYTGERRWVQRDIKRIVNRIRNAVLTIQAAARGHLVRSRMPFRDCCMCLSHRICPLKTSVGMMCRACAEQGPYVDITGPLSDEWNWFRSDYEDLTRRN